MIRKLRVKVVLTAMLSLLIVLTVIFGTAGIMNYKRIVTNANGILQILQDNGGSFPDLTRSNENGRASEENGETGEDGKTVDISRPSDVPPEMGAAGRGFSAELPYESRYFTVQFSENGDVLSVNTGKIAAVDTETAVQYAREVLAGGKSSGFVRDYRYMVSETGTSSSDGTSVIFLDCAREMGSLRSFLFTGISVSLIGLLAVLLLLIFFSGRIVRPFAENYQKQKQFITDAGHELKTPITIIDADAQVLEMDIGENEWISDIHLQTKRLTQLTQDLIQLSRMDEQRQIEKIEFPLSDVTQEIAENFQALAKTQNKTFSFDIQPMLSLKGDEKAIRQLVTILLDNAFKYSDDAGRIELTLKKRKNDIVLGVFNTTEHVSKESLPLFFDRFYRTDQSRNSKTGGYGLGLSIASAIVSSHGGKIRAETSDEKSLRITAIVPAG